jgi:glycosyltransferase involved in cell wall biosynthesis
VTDVLRRPAPAIGIGLPVFNGARYVAEAIGSVLAQTETEFELVICDNASTDATEEICRAFADSDERVRYVRHASNLGGAPNYNECLSRSSATTYFKWLAHDDTIAPDFLERCRDALEREPSASLAYPVLVEIDEDGVPFRTVSEDMGFRSADAGRRAGAFVREIHRSRDVFWAMFGLARRSALAAGRPHGSYIASDQVFLFELVLAGKVIHVSDTYYTRRVHDQASMSANVSPEARAAWYDSSKQGRAGLPHWMLLGQHVVAAHRANVSHFERLGAYRAIAWRAGHEWRNLGGDVKASIRARWSRARNRTFTAVT